MANSQNGIKHILKVLWCGLTLSLNLKRKKYNQDRNALFLKGLNNIRLLFFLNSFSKLKTSLSSEFSSLTKFIKFKAMFTRTPTIWNQKAIGSF